MSGLLLNLLLLVVACVILVKTATVLVKSITKIGAYFRISEFSAAFILMAFITSLPELAVAINSAIDGNPNLALGTALGSNLTDLTLVISIPVLLAGGIKVKSIIAQKDSLFMALFAIVPIIMLSDRVISRADGVILLIFYFLYLYRLMSQRSHFDDYTNHVTRPTAIREFGVFAIATTFLFISSRLLVYSSTNIAEVLGIPVVLVGLVLVAAGTSLPELAYELKAVVTDHKDQVLGDVLGSVVANSTVVIAVAALIHPINIVSFDTVATTIVYLMVVLVLFLGAIYTDKELKVKEALLLLFIYILFIFTEFGLEILHQAQGIL